MLSKSKGQILRVAAALHILFHMGSLEAVSTEITEEAVAAAIDFVYLCCQQSAFMGGRGDIDEEIQIIKTSILNIRVHTHIYSCSLYRLYMSHLMGPICSLGVNEEAASDADGINTPAHCLRLPGKRLNLTALLYAKKFRFHGYKKGALAAFQTLESAELGTIETTKTKGYVQYFFSLIQAESRLCSFISYHYVYVHDIYTSYSTTFIKAPIPAEAEGKMEFAKKLMKFSVSLLEYSKTLQQDEIQLGLHTHAQFNAAIPKISMCNCLHLLTNMYIHVRVPHTCAYPQVS